MVRPLVFRSLLLAALFLLMVPVSSAGPAHDHQDHPDPGVTASFALFPQHDTVTEALERHRDHPWVTVHELGSSTDGRSILLAEITDPDAQVPRDERAVTFIFTQQHGNEPAGTPAALQLLEDITAGRPIADTLDEQVLLLLPMANPDGAAANVRRNAQDLDINRDHISLASPEAQALHKVLNDWDVHVAFDHHEYGGIGFGSPVPVRLYDYDLTTLYPVHGNVREGVRGAAMDLMYDGLWPKAREEGYTANEYGEQTVNGQPLQQIAGGPDPGIMRNHLGLHHVAGILVETLVGDSVEGNAVNPFHDAERRTAIHLTVMEAGLEYVHEHAAHFRSMKTDALETDHDHPWTAYDEDPREGPLPPAYAVPVENQTDRLFSQHGLHPGHPLDGHIVHNLAGAPYAGHMAAMLHPESSRAVAVAAATDAYVPATDGEVAEEVPASAIIGLALIGLLGALGRRR